MAIASRFASACATCGVGYSPIAPGTFGSALGLAAGYWVMDRFGWLELAIGLIVLTLAGFWASARYLATRPGATDPKEIVIDEVVGQWLALLVPMLLLHFGVLIQTGTLLPIAVERHWVPYYFALAFLLFRLFDIAKPWPVSFFDRKVKGAAGVMLDDVAAGIMAGVMLYVIYIVGPSVLGGDEGIG
jgi:phosphatidylglycerophosphatase A